MQFVPHAQNAAQAVMKPRVTACSLCHSRKVKCDAHSAGFPCTNCRRSGVTDCRPHQKRKRRRSDTAEAPNGSGTSPASMNGNQSVAGGEVDNIYYNDLKQLIDNNGEGHRPIDREARLTYLGTDASNLSFLFRHDSANGKVLHRPTDQFAREITVYEPRSIPREAMILPDRSTIDRLLHGYFKHINPGFAIVDEDRFMEQYEARDPDNPPSLLLLQSILMVGAHVVYPAAQRHDIKAIYYHRAKLLFDSRFERSRDITVQAALLLAWHTDGADDAVANSWIWIRTAASIALGLGMHRDADDSTLPSYKKKMWRRVFWLMFRQEVLCAMAYGRPQSIRLEDCDVKPLERSDFAECGINTMIDFVISSVDLCIIISETMTHRFGPKIDRAQRQQALATADQALAELSASLPDSLALRPPASMAYWPSILQLIYHTFLIILHRPMMGQQEYDAGSQIDIGICNTAAGHVQSLLEHLCSGPHLSSMFNFSVHSAFTALVQFNVERRLPNPILSLSAARRFESTFRSIEKLAEVWPNVMTVISMYKRPAGIDPENVGVVADRVGLDIPRPPSRDPTTGGFREWAAPEPDTTDDQFNWKNLFPEETVEAPEDLFSWNTEWRELYHQEPLGQGWTYSTG